MVVENYKAHKTYRLYMYISIYIYIYIYMNYVLYKYIYIYSNIHILNMTSCFLGPNLQSITSAQEMLALEASKVAPLQGSQKLQGLEHV